jgi:hypothetical protein
VAKIQFENIDLGPLPIGEVNKCLGLELKSGNVRFSGIAQFHAFERHPNDFELCLQHIQRITLEPNFIGRGPNQVDGFELIGKVPNHDKHILVAVKCRINSDGFYEVASTYRIDTYTVRRRLRKGFLIEV